MQFSHFIYLATLQSLCFFDRTAATTSTDTSSSPISCPNLLLPGPEPLYNLPTDFPTPTVIDPVITEIIRQTLALYPLAIDGKNWGALARIFDTNAYVNYSNPLGVLRGVDQIISVLSQSLSQFVSTQHLYGTQYIDVCNGFSAVSVTYFRAAHFFSPFVNGTTAVNTTEILWAYGQYQDTWARQGDGTWKIANRNLVYMVSAGALDSMIWSRDLLTMCNRGRW